MKFRVKSGVGMALSVLSAVGVAATVLSRPGIAQQNTVSPLQDFNSQNSDSGSSIGIDQGTMFQLIHQAQMGTLDRDMNAVYDNQQNNIQDAAADFRAKQRQLFEQRNPQAGGEGSSDVEALNLSN